jgi:DNA-directed RNA polymerase subunit omega
MIEFTTELGLTSEMASEAAGGRYDMVLIASRRARELRAGWKSTVANPNEVGPIGTALHEIELGIVGREYLLKSQNLDRKERQARD